MGAEIEAAVEGEAFAGFAGGGGRFGGRGHEDCGVVAEDAGEDLRRGGVSEWEVEKRLGEGGSGYHDNGDWEQDPVTVLVSCFLGSLGSCVGLQECWVSVDRLLHSRDRHLGLAKEVLGIALCKSSTRDSNVSREREEWVIWIEVTLDDNRDPTYCSGAN